MNLRELFIIEMTEEYLTGNSLLGARQLYKGDKLIAWDDTDEYFGLCNNDMYIDKKYCRVIATLVTK